MQRGQQGEKQQHITNPELLNDIIEEVRNGDPAVALRMCPVSGMIPLQASGKALRCYRASLGLAKPR